MRCLVVQGLVGMGHVVRSCSFCDVALLASQSGFSGGGLWAVMLLADTCAEGSLTAACLAQALRGDRAPILAHLLDTSYGVAETDPAVRTITTRPSVGGSRWLFPLSRARDAV